MTFLPIVERELRVRARSKVTFRVRMGSALIASAIIVFFLLMSWLWFSPGKMGQGVFWFLSGLAFLWCLVEGPRNTADALSEEKRDGTLGLLFLTDLKPHDVVLGKLLATSLNSFYGVLAILPPLGIPLLLGGVTFGEFWRVVLVLIVTLFFSLSAGMFISATSRDERRAWFGTVLLLAFLTVIPPLFHWLPAPTTILFSWCSPAVGFLSANYSQFARMSDSYWQSIIGAQLLGLGFLVTACLVLPHSWQDKPVQRANREVRTGLRLRQEVRRRRSMHENPVVWMLTRGKGGATVVWVLVLGTTIPALALSIIWEGASFLAWPFAIGALAVHTAIAIWIAAQACFLIADARNSGALDLLLTTPIHPHRIVDGHVEALRRQFFAPVGTFMFLEVAIVLNFLGFNANKTGNGFEFLLLFGIFALAMVAVDLLAVAWFGLWMGLTNKKSAHAVMKTVVYVLILPMLTLACWCMWPITSIVKDLIFINYARTRLRQQFRNIVTEGVIKRPTPMMWERPPSWPPKLPSVLDK